MNGKNFDIFISYRKNDGEHIAKLLNLLLSTDDCRIFFEDKSLKEEVFDKRIETALLDAPIFVMILTLDYFKHCNEDSDSIRQEIDLAIDNSKIIIPINYNGALEDVPYYLDEEFRKKVSRYNFITLHTDTSFKATLKELFEKNIKPNVLTESNAKNKIKVNVKTDVDCELIEDNVIIATLQAGITKQIFAEKGNHKFISRSNEFPQLEETIEKIIDDIESKHILRIKLADKVKSLQEEKEFEEILKKQKQKILDPLSTNKYKLLKTLKGHLNVVSSVAYSPDGKHIVSSSWDETIKIWNTESGICLKTIEVGPDCVDSVTYSPDGKRIVTGLCYGSIKIWDANKHTCLKTLKAHINAVPSVKYSPDGKHIISNSFDGNIKIWDANTYICLKTLNEDYGNLHSAACSPDGKRIISILGRDTIKIWDANTYICLQTLKGHLDDITSVAYSPDGKHIVSGSWDETIKIWDTESGICLKTLNGYSGKVSSVAYSPDGKHIVSGSKVETIKIWNIESGKCIQLIDENSGEVYSVAYSPDGKHIVCSSEDSIIRIWGEK